MEITLNGEIMSNGNASVYRYFGLDAICPNDVVQALRQMTEDETWMDPARAIALGFAQAQAAVMACNTEIEQMQAVIAETERGAHTPPAPQASA